MLQMKTTTNGTHLKILYVEDIFKKLKNFLNNFSSKGEWGSPASVENSTKFIYIFI